MSTKERATPGTPKHEQQRVHVAPRHDGRSLRGWLRERRLNKKLDDELDHLIADVEEAAYKYGVRRRPEKDTFSLVDYILSGYYRRRLARLHNMADKLRHEQEQVAYFQPPATEQKKKGRGSRGHVLP